MCALWSYVLCTMWQCVKDLDWFVVCFIESKLNNLKLLYFRVFCSTHVHLCMHKYCRFCSMNRRAWECIRWSVISFVHYRVSNVVVLWVKVMSCSGVVGIRLIIPGLLFVVNEINYIQFLAQHQYFLWMFDL